MKKLLIHSNNTSFNNTELFPLSEQFVFDVDFDKDVDFYINENLTDGGLKQKLEKCDIAFIKVSLSKNYLEYLGLRLAYHIRLTKSLGEKAYIPIVFIAEESIQFLGLTYHEPSILFTQGIYLIKETLKDFQKAAEWFNSGKIKPLDEFSSFVSTIKINPPVNYLSHHSIANEWALTRYFSMFEKDESNNLYANLENKIRVLGYLKTLHFKHLEAKENRQKFNPKRHSITPDINGITHKRIGIIDDEINKGWLEFYAYILNKSNAKSIPFIDFKKDETRSELIERIQHWLLENFTSNEPIDVFIIDLRLHDDDFTDQDFNNLSGIQIIKFIKKCNPGIQIVVSTASNKVWNYQKCLEFGVKYFSIKESPETYNNRYDTKKSFIHFSKEISNAVEDSFLADLYRKIKGLKNKNIFANLGVKEKEFGDLTFGENGLLDQIFNLLILDSDNDSVLNQCLLLSFQILENYCELSSVASFGSDNSKKIRLASGFVWKRDQTKLQIFVNQKDLVHTLFELEYGKYSFQIDKAFSTPISFKAYEEMQTKTSFKSGLDASSLVKLISVLKFREGIEDEKIVKLMELRYYRSNVAAHLTGNVDLSKRRFTAINDLVFLLDVFDKMF